MTLDSDLHEKMLLMARNLLEATKEAKISWALTDMEGKFLYAGTRSSVTIERYRDNDGDEIAILSLLNNRGTTVDSIQSEFQRQPDNKWSPAEWNELLDNLYYAARRVAYNVDEAVESMLADIEAGTPSPSPPSKKKLDDPWAQTGYSDEPPF